MPKLRAERRALTPDPRFLHAVQLVRSGHFGWEDYFNPIMDAITVGEWGGRRGGGGGGALVPVTSLVAITVGEWGGQKGGGSGRWGGVDRRGNVTLVPVRRNEATLVLVHNLVCHHPGASFPPPPESHTTCLSPCATNHPQACVPLGTHQ